MSAHSYTLLLRALLGGCCLYLQYGTVLVWCRGSGRAVRRQLLRRSINNAPSPWWDPAESCQTRAGTVSSCRSLPLSPGERGTWRCITDAHISRAGTRLQKAPLLTCIQRQSFPAEFAMKKEIQQEQLSVDFFSLIFFLPKFFYF